MCRSDIVTTASTKMKVVMLALHVVSASAMTSGVSSSRMQNPSNVNERSYNVRLRGLEKRHKDHAEIIAKQTKAVAKESGEDATKSARPNSDETTAKEDRKEKKKELKKEQAKSKIMDEEPTNDTNSLGTATADGWVPTPSPSDAPTPKSSVKPTQSPTSLALSAVQEMASIEVESTQAVDVIPACPPAYDITKTDYFGGDLVTMTDNIFECDSPYGMYCNIGEWDDALLDQDTNAMDMWSDAWVHVGPCSALAVVLPEPTSLTTLSPTLAPSIEVEASQAADVIHACPTAYDITKTDYLGGDKVTITENIFECHSLYVMYCNIGEWDESLLAQDENAEEMWSDAWVYVGPCA
jgi:hypothetical protein